MKQLKKQKKITILLINGLIGICKNLTLTWYKLPIEYKQLKNK